MRDPNRLYVFYEEFRRIHMEYFNDLRFGQFIDNFRYWLSDKKRCRYFLAGRNRFTELSQRIRRRVGE